MSGKEDPRPKSIAREHRPPDGGTDEAGKLTRISRESKGLVEDVKSWVELKMTLTQMDIEAQVDARLNRAIVGVIVGALGFLGLTFALVAASIGLGVWLGNGAWGFLIVAGALFLLTILLMILKPRFVDVAGNREKNRNTDG